MLKIIINRSVRREVAVGFVTMHVGFVTNHVGFVTRHVGFVTMRVGFGPVCVGGLERSDMRYTH